jgi:hypothetical protein
MRLSCLYLLILAPSVLSACGGGASPPPKNEAAAVERGAATKDSHADQARSASTAAAEPTQPATATTAGGGDIVAPASDDPWMAPHQMPSSDVLKTMRAAQGKVTACWRAAKKRDPSVSGEVKIKFVISHEGSVRVWRNEDSAVSDEDCINCVGDVIKSLQFPTQKAPGDAWGIYQINFGG